MPSVAPGPWLRLTALGAAGATLLAVVSGAAGLGSAHRVLAALALPPLVALVVAGWVVHRRLLGPSVAALALFGAAALVSGSGGAHVVLAAGALSGRLAGAAPALRGG